VKDKTFFSHSLLPFWVRFVFYEIIQKFCKQDGDIINSSSQYIMLNMVT
jgi:hypothetical protein